MFLMQKDGENLTCMFVLEEQDLHIVHVYRYEANAFLRECGVQVQFLGLGDLIELCELLSFRQ